MVLGLLVRHGLEASAGAGVGSKDRASREVRAGVWGVEDVTRWGVSTHFARSDAVVRDTAAQTAEIMRVSGPTGY